MVDTRTREEIIQSFLMLTNYTEEEMPDSLRQTINDYLEKEGKL
jgi:hypothetical protein